MSDLKFNKKEKKEAKKGFNHMKNLPRYKESRWRWSIRCNKKSIRLDWSYLNDYLFTKNEKKESKGIKIYKFYEEVTDDTVYVGYNHYGDIIVMTEILEEAVTSVMHWYKKRY